MVGLGGPPCHANLLRFLLGLGLAVLSCAVLFMSSLAFFRCSLFCAIEDQRGLPTGMVTGLRLLLRVLCATAYNVTGQQR